MADRLSLFSVPPCVTRLVPLAVLVAGLSVPALSTAGQKVNAKKSRGGPAAATSAAASSTVVVEEAVSLEAEGDAALAEGRLAEAAGRYAAAIQRVPGPSKQRETLVSKFASTSVKLAEEQGRNGQIDQATLTLNTVLDERVAPGYKPAIVLKEQLQDADRFNPAQTPAHAEATKKVRDLFTMADGFMAIGDFKAAAGCYNQILVADSTNSAARRGLERTEREINNYLRSARDHTRLKMINDVDRNWESPVVTGKIMPHTMRGPQSGAVEPASGYSLAARKMQTIVLDRVNMSDTPLRDALNYLVRKSRELDLTEPNPEARGVNIIFTPGTKPESAFPAVTLDLNATSLGDALKSVASLTGTRISTEGNTIRVTPLGEGNRIEVRRFRVDPGFLTRSGTAQVDAGGAQDPFGGGDNKETSGLKITRLSAKEWLERNGVPFPEGTGADYVPGQNLLVVRNTEENLALVDTVVESTTDKTQRQVKVTVTMLKAEQRNLEELGYDWLVGQTNIGGNGVFASGGTVGNALNGSNLAENYSIVSPNGLPVGGNPVTAGLRGASELKNNPNIDDLIASGTTSPAGGGRSPGIFGVAGVFTDPQFSMMMRGLNQKTGIDISTAQTLILKAGQRAKAESIRQIPYPTEFDPPQIPQTFDSGGATVLFDDGSILDIPGGGGTAPVTPTTPQSFEFKDTGSTLEVEATVGGDGTMVDISVSAIFSEFDGFINYGTPITANGVVLTDNKIFQPVFSKVAVNTPSLSIADGSTITLGGLSSGQWTTINDKVPLLGDIPFIGRFFRSDVKQVTRKAVIYFIKVEVMDPGGVGVREAAALEEKAAAESATGGR